MSKGGKRIGAGRPKGTKNLRRFQDYWTEKEILAFVEAGKARYLTSDKVFIEFTQQIFGKAPQALDVTSGGEKLPTPIMYVPTDHGDKESSGA